MEFKQIQYFLSVARSLNFTQSATELHISQATLSRQISAMESELNLLLFFRDNRNVKLTECGKYLSTELANVYNNYNTVITNAQNMFRGYSGHLTVGILNETILYGKLQDIFYEYQNKYTNQQLDLRRYSFRSLTNGLMDFSLDFAITMFFDISNLTSLKYKVLYKMVSGILVSGKNSLSKKETIDIKELYDQNFIMVSGDDSPAASKNFICKCKEYGFYPKIRFAPNLDTAMLWTEAGMGITFSHEKALSSMNPGLKFIPFTASDVVPEDSIVLAWNSANTNSAIKAFLKFLDN